MANISSYADIWLTLMLGCDGWEIKAVDPLMLWDDNPAHKQKPMNTSFPLLFLSNPADPVTPLYSGVRMARKFVDAGLVEQLSEGHCTISTVSACTIEKIRAYLHEGKVPPNPKWGPEGREIEEGEWERCDSSEWPWKPFQGKRWMSNIASEGYVDAEEARAEARRLDAWKDVQGWAKDFLGYRVGETHGVF